MFNITLTCTVNISMLSVCNIYIYIYIYIYKWIYIYIYIYKWIYIYIYIYLYNQIMKYTVPNMFRIESDFELLHFFKNVSRINKDEESTLPPMAVVQFHSTMCDITNNNPLSNYTIIHPDINVGTDSYIYIYIYIYIGNILITILTKYSYVFMIKFDINMIYYFSI